MSTDTTTRAEYHADTDAETVRTDKDAIAWLLERRRGRGAAISSKGLADAVGLRATTVRDAVKEVRRDRDLPVVACSQGYYLLDSRDGLADELDRIADEIQTRRETRGELARAYNRYHEVR